MFTDLLQTFEQVFFLLHPGSLQFKYFAVEKREVVNLAHANSDQFNDNAEDFKDA